MKSSLLHTILILSFSLCAESVIGASLWTKSTNSERGIFAGKRAFSRGDLLTIDVAESSSLAASQNSVRNRQSQIENAVQQFLFANSGMGKHKGQLPATEIETKSSNQGGGSISNTQDLKGRISVVVIDVLPNGVLVIEGARLVTFSGESYYAVLKGMVRQEDIGFGFKDGFEISEYSCVSVYRRCSSRIRFKGKLKRCTKESWYQRLAAILNPF